MANASRSGRASRTSTARITDEQPARAEADAGVGGADRVGADGCLVVTGPRQGRRRAGRAFGPETVSIPLADLSGEEVEAILSDPLLVAVHDPEAS